MRGGLLACVCGALTLALTAAAPAAAQAPRLLGAQSCASAACHDAREAQPNASVAQNEYRRWSTGDRHARAFETLSGPRADDIMRKSGLGTAGEAPVCLGCHTAALPGVATGPRFTLTEGVSCEACHGPASNWIGPHARGLYHYDQVLAAGLFPTADVAARARQCLRCHGPNPGVDHALIAAGHPRARFDLASFSRLQPAHFVLDADYLQRKRPATEATAWAVGASAVLASRLEALSEARGLFPDFSVLNCDGCHRPVSNNIPIEGVRTPAERLRNIADLAELSSLLAMADAAAPAQAASVRASLATLEAAADSRTALQSAAHALGAALRELSAEIARTGIDGAQAKVALAALVSRQRETHRLEADAASYAMRALARTASDAGALSAADVPRVLAQFDERQSSRDAGDAPDLRALLRANLRQPMEQAP